MHRPENKTKKDKKKDLDDLLRIWCLPRRPLSNTMTSLEGSCGLHVASSSGIAQVCVDPELCTRVLEGRFIPGLGQLSERDPAPVDADLGKV